jgi:tRNA 2-thiocytidine biosynthesis protein TtcA
MKALLAREEALHPRLFRNLRTAMDPLMRDAGRSDEGDDAP